MAKTPRTLQVGKKIYLVTAKAFDTDGTRWTVSIQDNTPGTNEKPTEFSLKANSEVDAAEKAEKTFTSPKAKHTGINDED